MAIVLNKFEEKQTLHEFLLNDKETEIENVNEDLLTEEELRQLEIQEEFNNLTRNFYEEI